MKTKFKYLLEMDAFGQGTSYPSNPDNAFGSRPVISPQERREAEEIKKYGRVLPQSERDLILKYSKGGPSTHPFYSNPNSFAYKQWQQEQQRNKSQQSETGTKSVVSTFQNSLKLTEQSGQTLGQSSQQSDEGMEKTIKDAQAQYAMMQALRTPETDPTKPTSAELNLSKLLSVKRRVAYQPTPGKFYYTTQETERKQ